MKFYQYDYIIALAEERNFTKASKKLFISQPSLSQYTSMIEKELGVLLFDRSTNPIELTEAGQLFVDTAYKMMALQYKLKSEISDISDSCNGLITVGMTPYRCSTILPYVLLEFKRTMPNVKFNLITGTMQELSNYALEGVLDIFISTESYLNKNLD
jgi:LysR family hydrogen peroxide-inducible transcriptional activator